MDPPEATCGYANGLPESEFCGVFNAWKCEACSKTNPDYHHPPEAMTDAFNKSTYWQSEPWFMYKPKQNRAYNSIFMCSIALAVGKFVQEG